MGTSTAGRSTALAARARISQIARLRVQGTKLHMTANSAANVWPLSSSDRWSG